MNKKKSKIRIIFWGAIALFAIYVLMFSPGAIQGKNMKERNKQIKIIEAILQKDKKFGKIKFRLSTANLGRDVIVTGSVKNEKDLEKIKSIIQNNISRKFQVGYYLTIEKENE